MQVIIDACKDGSLNAEITAVVTSKPESGAASRSKSAGIPCYVSGLDLPKNGDATENRTLKLLKESEVEWVLLLGYTRKIETRIISEFRNRIINTHPSLLPKFGGKGFYGRKVHQAVFDSGEKITGATIHLVNEEYDSGKILSQITVEVLPDDSPETIERRVKEAEKAQLVRVLKTLW